MDLICRAHQVVEDGYEFFSKRQLVTLFSAPNYCGEFDNAGAMMSVDESLLCSFQVRAITLPSRAPQLISLPDSETSGEETKVRAFPWRQTDVSQQELPQMIQTIHTEQMRTSRAAGSGVVRQSHIVKPFDESRLKSASTSSPQHHRYRSPPSFLGHPDPTRHFASSFLAPLSVFFRYLIRLTVTHDQRSSKGRTPW
jgi:hypothetical protein